MTSPASVETQPPWEAISAEAQSEARQRQAALVPALERWHNPLVTHEELESGAVATYERITGSRIDVRTVRRWIRDAIERDNGRRDFSRPELFLRRNPPLRPQHRAELTRAEQPFAPLFDLLQRGVAKPGELTGSEEEGRFWSLAWKAYQQILAAGYAPKSAKADLLAFLQKHAGWLTHGSKNALRMMVARQFQKFETSNSDVRSLAAAATDGRRARRGVPTAEPIPASDIDKLVGYALFETGGRFAQAKRHLVAMGESSGLSAATLDLLDSGKSKSYVNRRIADQVQPIIKDLAPFRLGRKAVDDATPSLRRDYSALRSMQIVVADDFTMPVYFYIPDGKGWFELTRGQVLLFIDVRSLKIITWALIPARNYNGLQIRSAMNTVCMDHGRPDVWYFERGIWLNSNLVKNRPPKEWRLAHESQATIEHGWERLGVRFMHATRARSKPAELVGGKLQNTMEGCRGYCGRNEREDCPEETKKAKLAVEGRREHPSKYFYSFDEWHTALSNRIAAYNAEVQQGEILEGRSPDRAFEEFWPHDNPPAKFDSSCWHLCAHYASERKVTVDGIEFKLGNIRYSYNGDALNSYRHQTVIAYFDPEHPEHLAFTDKSGRNPSFVTRTTKVGFADAISDDELIVNRYREAVAQQKGQIGEVRARYTSIKATFQRTFRQNLTDRETAALGRELLVQKKAVKDQQSHEERTRSRAAHLARRIGVSTATVDLESPETEQALRRRVARREALENEQAAEPESEKT